MATPSSGTVQCKHPKSQRPLSPFFLGRARRHQARHARLRKLPIRETLEETMEDFMTLRDWCQSCGGMTDLSAEKWNGLDPFSGRAPDRKIDKLISGPNIPPFLAFFFSKQQRRQKDQVQTRSARSGDLARSDLGLLCPEHPGLQNGRGERFGSAGEQAQNRADTQAGKLKTWPRQLQEMRLGVVWPASNESTTQALPRRPRARGFRRLCALLRFVFLVVSRC